MARQAEPTIVVIGAGFSGTMVAVHLLRSASRRRRRVVLVERAPRVGRGVAYGTVCEGHLLNVVAGRMSALVGDEDAFVRFAAQHDPRVSGGSFLSRRLYGDYLEDLLRRSVAAAPAWARLEHVEAEAVDLQVDERGGVVDVVLRRPGRAGVERITAERVVLAAGHSSPADPEVEDRRFFEDPRYVRDPWAPGALEGIAPGEETLLIGTGLTMFDMAIALRAGGVQGTIEAISRHGLLPRWHRSPATPPARNQRPPGIQHAPHTARRLLRAVRSHAALVSRDVAADWREVVNSLRPVTPDLWRALDLRERARFLRHLKPWWDVHRHRAAPAVGAAIESMIATGTLRVHAGRILRFRRLRGRIHVEYVPRGSGEVARVRVDRVINCTGPRGDVRKVAEPLIRALLAGGLVRADPLGLGLDTTHDLALIAASGRPSRLFYLAGPLLRGTFGEAVAVPELREHAATAARSVLASLGTRRSIG